MLVKARSHRGDAWGTHGRRIENRKKVVSPNFVRIWDKLASWLGMHSVLLERAACIQGVCSTYVWRWSSALRACLASFWRVHSCVELRAHFWACSKSPDAHSEWRRMHNVGPALVQRARRTSNEWWRTPSERQRTGLNCKFPMRWPLRPPCVPSVWPGLYRKRL